MTRRSLRPKERPERQKVPIMLTLDPQARVKQDQRDKMTGTCRRAGSMMQISNLGSQGLRKRVQVELHNNLTNQKIRKQVQKGKERNKN